MGAITLRASSMMKRRILGKRNTTTTSARKIWCADTAKPSIETRFPNHATAQSRHSQSEAQGTLNRG
jgi:hypothetical protein